MKSRAAKVESSIFLGPSTPLVPISTAHRPGRSAPGPSWIRGSFGDDVWVSKDADITTNAPVRIDFSRIASEFRGHSKLMVWLAEYSMDNSQKGARRVTSPNRFRTTFTDLVTISNWLRVNGLSAYAQVSEDRFAEFLEDWVARPRVRSGLGPSESAYAQMLATCRRIYRMGPKGIKHLDDGFLFDPDEVADAIGSGRLVVPSTRTPEIPDESARKMFTSAHYWLKRLGPPTLALLKWHRASRSRGKGHRWGETRRIRTEYLLSGDRRRAMEELLAALPFSVGKLHRDERKEMRARDLSKQADALFFLATRLTPILKTLAGMLVAAAYYVMGILSGFRVKEMLSITQGAMSRRSHGWMVSSTVFKTAEDRSGFRTDRPVPEGFEMAHRMLRRLGVAMGVTGPSARVFLGSKGKSWTALTANARLRQFARLHGLEWHFTTHQLRKYFALFYVRRFRGPLDALRWHFRHVDSRMIMAYVGDAWGARFLAEAEASLMEEVLTSIIHGRSAMTHGGVPESEARYAAANLPLEEVEQLAGAVRGEGGALLAMEWGYCLQQPESGAGACAATSAEERSLRRCPGICGACPLLAVGPENAARWRQTRALHQTVVKSPLSLPLAKEASARMVEMASGLLASVERAKAEASA